MNDEQKQKYFKDFVDRKLAGMSNLSDYPTKEETETKLKDSIKSENIKDETLKFFTEKSDGVK